jgi:dTDP-4-dehydrorhamnose reductase
MTRTNGGKILVVGGSSRIGACFLRHSEPGRVIATYHHRPHAGGIVFDAARQRLEDVDLPLSQISHALILFAVPDPDRCLADPEKARNLNVSATLAVVDTLISHGIVPVFMSSEAVFDGEKGDYREEDVANPISYYGRLKLEVEQHMADTEALTLRISRVVGTTPGDGTMFTNWLSQLQRGDSIVCAGDQRFSPIHEDDVAEAIQRLIEHRCRGLYHVCGPEGLTRLAMLALLVERFKQSGGRMTARVESCSIDDFPTPERRPRDVSMSCKKLVDATGFTPRNVSAICQEMVRCPTTGR